MDSKNLINKLSTIEDYLRTKNKYNDNPVQFIENCFDTKLLSYQKILLHSLFFKDNITMA